MDKMQNNAKNKKIKKMAIGARILNLTHLNNKLK